MAKISKALTLKNVSISLEDMTFTEIGKDTYEEFKIMDILREWDGAEGVTINFKEDNDFKCSESKSEDGDEG